jgi:hypothetical protein
MIRIILEEYFTLLYHIRQEMGYFLSEWPSCLLHFVLGLPSTSVLCISYVAACWRVQCFTAVICRIAKFTNAVGFSGLRLTCFVRFLRSFCLLVRSKLSSLYTWCPQQNFTLSKWHRIRFLRNFWLFMWSRHSSPYTWCPQQNFTLFKWHGIGFLRSFCLLVWSTLSSPYTWCPQQNFILSKWHKIRFLRSFWLLMWSRHSSPYAWCPQQNFTLSKWHRVRFLRSFWLLMW